MSVRVVILTEIPAPFRLPLFTELARCQGIDPHVLFLAARDPRRSYPAPGRTPFPATVLRGAHLVRGKLWIVLSRGVFRALRRSRPDVIVIGGWNQPAYWQAIAYARLRRVPLVTWVESTGSDARSGRRLFESAKRVAVRASSAVIVPGAAAAAYVEALGVQRERLALAANAFDLGRFTAEVDAARSERDRIRKSLGLDGECVFLCVARLVPEKAHDVLLQAFSDVPGTLLLAGGGPQEARLRALAPARVRFLGDIAAADLPRLYAAVDAFVLVSRSETWGMVLNEAAAAGLPIVASDAVGAAHDLVDDGRNGHVVPAVAVAPLAAALRHVAEDEEFRVAAGARSRELAEPFTPANWAAVVSGLVARLGARPPPERSRG